MRGNRQLRSGELLARPTLPSPIGRRALYPGHRVKAGSALDKNAWPYLAVILANRAQRARNARMVRRRPWGARSGCCSAVAGTIQDL